MEDLRFREALLVVATMIFVAIMQLFRRPQK